MASRKKLKPPPSPFPWRCVVLSIDPGAKGGAAVWSCGVFMMSWPVRTDAEKGVVVRYAYDVARRNGLPLVVVFETWRPPAEGFGYMAGRALAASKASWKTIVNMGMPFKLGRRTFPKYLEVYAATWQARVLTVGRANRDQRIEATIDAGNTYSDEPCIDDNEAAARCIGYWATRAGEVGELLPEEFRRAA